MDTRLITISTKPIWSEDKKGQFCVHIFVFSIEISAVDNLECLNKVI